MEGLLRPLPEPVGLLLLTAFAISLGVLSVTRARGSRLAQLGCATCGLLAVESAVLTFVDLSAWRAQVLAVRAVELPVVASVGALCVLQSRKVTADKIRLKTLLSVAPAILFSAWFTALVGEMVWPQPSLDPFASMPVRNFLLLTPLCVPILSYLSLLAFLHARTAGLRTPATILRLKNALLSTGIAAYLLVLLSGTVGYAVRTFAPDGLRENVILTQIALEQRLFLVVYLSIPLALALGTVPAAKAALLGTVVPSFLRLKDTFEARRWQLNGAGALRGLTRPLYLTQDAAARLGLSRHECDKAKATVELVAMLGSPALPPDVSSEKARRLLEMRREILSLAPDLEQRLRHAPALRSDQGDPASWADPLPEALEAAWRLTSKSSHVAPRSPRSMNPLWYELAAVVCNEHQLITSANGADDHATRLDVSRAYQESLHQIT